MPKNKKKLKISRKTNTRKNQLFYVTLKQTYIRYLLEMFTNKFKNFQNIVRFVLSQII